MKHLLVRTLLVACLVFIAGEIIAQPPPAMNYQLVAKDPLGNVAKNRKIYTKIIILTSPVGGVKVWEESHVTNSNDDGVFTVVIGRGTKSATTTLLDIGQIDWANGPFFLNTKVAVEPSVPAAWWVAADNYLDMGTTQMLSVPYALFAGNASVTNVNTSIQPGPPNTFLITDSLGNVNWQTPQAANQTVTTITNFNLSLNVVGGTNVSIPPNTTAIVTVAVPGVKRGDPIIVTPQDDYLNWAVYSAWVAGDDVVRIRFANYTDLPVAVLGSQYKIVVIK
ncbi:hypothetical protein JZU61_06195 [bacterium]|nr:hypothetical protein [bacterium]